MYLNPDEPEHQSRHYILTLIHLSFYHTHANVKFFLDLPPNNVNRFRDFMVTPESQFLYLNPSTKYVLFLRLTNDGFICLKRSDSRHCWPVTLGRVNICVGVMRRRN